MRGRGDGGGNGRGVGSLERIDLRSQSRPRVGGLLAELSRAAQGVAGFVRVPRQQVSLGELQVRVVGRDAVRAVGDDAGARLLAAVDCVLEPLDGSWGVAVLQRYDASLGFRRC